MRCTLFYFKIKILTANAFLCGFNLPELKFCGKFAFVIEEDVMMKHLFRIFAFTALTMTVISCQKEGSSEASGTSSNDGDTSLAQPKIHTADTVQDIQALPVSEFEGEAVGGAMNSIFLEDAQGVTRDFAYPDLDRDSIDGWEEGDVVRVIFTPSKDGDVVKSVRVVKHNGQ